MKQLNFFLQNKCKGTIVRSDLITALIFNKIQLYMLIWDLNTGEVTYSYSYVGALLVWYWEQISQSKL